jgi:hypothetical protein
MVGERGFEPPTPWSRTRCSTRLSHSPNDRAQSGRTVDPDYNREWPAYADFIPPGANFSVANSSARKFLWSSIPPVAHSSSCQFIQSRISSIAKFLSRQFLWSSIPPVADFIQSRIPPLVNSLVVIPPVANSSSRQLPIHPVANFFSCQIPQSSISLVVNSSSCAFFQLPIHPVANFSARQFSIVIPPRREFFNRLSAGHAAHRRM